MNRKKKTLMVCVIAAALFTLSSCAAVPSVSGESKPPAGTSTVSPTQGNPTTVHTAGPSLSPSPAISTAVPTPVPTPVPTASIDELVKKMTDLYGAMHPKEWSETATGVLTRLDTADKVIALTFDACGGSGGGGYDKELIDYLANEKVPATLFINSRWIDQNMETFLNLAHNSLFEIENHGTEHRPLSVNGQEAYGIKGTADIRAVVEEVKGNEDKIFRLTGRRPIYFRSGTAYYDEVALKILGSLGENAVGYNVLGDAGATYSAAEVKKACLSAKPGAIIICHMNHPEKETAEGIMQAVPALRAEGFRFVRLSDYPLHS